MSPGKPSKVWRYAREGKVSKLESYLERHPDVDLNWQNDDEKKAKTAVMVAGGHDHLASMRLLLDKGASPTIVVSYKGDERTCYGYFLSKSHPKVDSVVELVKRRIHPVTKQDKQLFIAKAREIATAGGAEIAEQMKEIMAALAGEAGVSVSMQGAHVMRIAGGGAGGAGGFPVPPGFPEGSDPRQLFQQAHELVTSGEASSMEEALKSLGVKMGGTVIVSGGSGTKFTMSASSPAAGASDDDGSDDEKSAGLKRAKPSRSDEKKRKGDDRDAAPARPAMSKMMSADDEDDDDDDGGPINAADEMTETSAELWNAAKDGNLITVRAILSVGGADLEYLNGTRAGKEGTALMISMARRHMEVGELLLNAGASMRTTTTVTHKEKKSKRSRRPRRDHHVSVVGYVLSYKKEYTSAARLLELGAKLNTPDDRELAKEYADKILSKATRMEWTRAVRVMLELIDAEGLSISGGLDDARKLVAAADEAEATEEAEEDAAAAAPAPAAPAPAAPAPAPAPTPAGGGGGGGGGGSGAASSTDPLIAWLNSVRPSYGLEYADAFRAEGYETVEDLQLAPVTEEILREMGITKRVPLMRLKVACAKLAGGDGSGEESKADMLEGRYRIVQPLVTDGSRNGLVLAEDVKSRKTVVVKYVEEHSEWVREKDALQALESDFVVPLLDFYENVTVPDGRTVHLLVFPRGECTLATWLADNRDNVAHKFVLRRFAQCLAHMHGKGFVHGDIKPANIMLFKVSSAVTRWKLIDFGTAVRTGTPLTTQASPEFMAPEMGRADAEDGMLKLAADPAIDVWGFGMSVLNVLQGRSLFGGRLRGDGKLQDDAMAELMSEEPLRLGRLGSGSAQKLLYQYCLVKEPAKRSSMQMMLQRAFLKGTTTIGGATVGEEESTSDALKALLAPLSASLAELHAKVGAEDGKLAELTAAVTSVREGVTSELGDGFGALQAQLKEQARAAAERDDASSEALAEVAELLEAALDG